MTAEVRYYPRARLDLLEQATYLAENATVGTAERFLDAVERTSQRLLEMPRMGRAWEGLRSETKDVRVWKVEGFPKIMLFYRVEKTGISVIRILHGARDLPELMEDYV